MLLFNVKVPKKGRRLSLQLIDETVDKIVKSVVHQAAKGQEVDTVSLSIQNALIDTFAADLEPSDDLGFAILEYEHLEIYHGPTKLTDFIDESDLTDDSASKQEAEKSEAEAEAAAAAAGGRKVKGEPKRAHHIDGDVKHGEIIIIVRRGEKVIVKADENNDTVITNIHLGEVIIRNVDTNLILSISKNGVERDPVEMSIVGQAYIRDLTGSLKVKQFKGIVLVKTDLA
jgi:hypothetical protein